MPLDSDQFDFFVSYARSDNASGWITALLDELLAEHKKFAPDRPLKYIFVNGSVPHNHIFSLLSNVE